MDNMDSLRFQNSAYNRPRFKQGGSLSRSYNSSNYARTRSPQVLVQRRTSKQMSVTEKRRRELHEAGNFVRVWATNLGVISVLAELLVSCFDKEYLLAFPKPKVKYRVGNFTVVQRCRYLWYRKAAQVLGWKDQ